MECNRPGSSGAVASAGVCDAFGVLACRQRRGGGAAGGRNARALRLGCGIGDRRSGPARARPGADAQARLDHHSDPVGPRAVARRGQHGHAPVQVGSAHPDRRPGKRVPAAERRAQRGAQPARCRSRDEPGATVAVARSGPRDHQEEQACRAAGIRSRAAGYFAAEIVAGPGRHRTRPVLADAGRARAGSLLRPLHGLCGRQIPRHRRRIPVARSRTGRACRQLDRRGLSGAAAGRTPAAGEIREPVAVR